MPRGDRTGPVGMGAKSGRAFGFCGGYGAPGCVSLPTGGGFGRGRRLNGGGGQRLRNRLYAASAPGWRRFAGYYGMPYEYGPLYPMPDAKSEKLALQREADALQSQLEMITQRLSALETEVAQTSVEKE